MWIILFHLRFMMKRNILSVVDDDNRANRTSTGKRIDRWFDVDETRSLVSVTYESTNLFRKENWTLKKCRFGWINLTAEVKKDSDAVNAKTMRITNGTFPELSLSFDRIQWSVLCFSLMRPTDGACIRKRIIVIIKSNWSKLTPQRRPKASQQHLPPPSNRQIEILFLLILLHIILIKSVDDNECMQPVNVCALCISSPWTTVDDANDIINKLPAPQFAYFIHKL